VDFYTAIISFSVNSGIPIKLILDFFYALRIDGAIDNKILVGRLGIAKVSLNSVKKEFIQYLESSTHETKLNKSGSDWIETYDWEKHRVLMSMWEYSYDNNSEKEFDSLKLRLKKRPSADRALDQFTATEETVYRRVKLMEHNGDIKDKRILLLGDDDFVSVAIALMSDAKSITVLDIDKRILHTIKEESRDLVPVISTVGYDAIKPLPKMYKDTFDTVFTDPPYTTNGIELFLSRAVTAINSRNRCSRIYLCFGNSDASKERFLPVCEIITKSGLMIREVRDKFNRYTGAESIGSTSTLFVLEYTPQTEALIKVNYDKKIYTNN